MRNPLEVYRNVEKATLEGRELEASVLLKAALRLRQAQQKLAAEQDVLELDEALRYNQRIWTLFEAEMRDPANALPQTIKDNLLALIRFIDRRTYALMADPIAERIDILININRNIADGLQGRVPQAANAA